MKTSHTYCILYSGAVLLLLSYGVCVLAEERTPLERRAAAGSSLILPLGYPKDSVSFAQWRYKEQIFSIYRNKNKQIAIINVLQFSGRLKVNSDDLSVEVMNLQLSDSGRYTIVTQSSSGDQLPTETIILIVYDVIKVEIRSEHTWKAATNSCDVSLQCRASEDQTVSYRWRGFKEEDGAQLNFTLKPEEGDVTLNCSASSSTGSGSNTTTVKCTPEKPTTGLPNPEASFSVLHLLSFLTAASPYLLFTIILGVKSYRARAKADDVNMVCEVREAEE
ncbi:SLAM family member 8-like isoform X1 [Astyanax mexicanus]|uniref:SLAM family member 8-like isoform X1 n=1 Tax=Astyanax mexicanus TaxID=7994 RepID=UPI0020CB2470|nr:SLAM family member 8-like isoform X1 [Astyanax mexicanus]XP_049338182.1 SLAM family member 8-like isoform X1 [Astyanax mexicanus]XP_049338183.1 SLAM family member 8-like isoform X1 [Astyanax mexicanus]XP_049338184.1 SLAM family member 8-like isoform X1 [Astyanax mexicanus]XP_049338185.1 SLAM family member 8-like isoform X1 [Astyanax mexicanus]